MSAIARELGRWAPWLHHYGVAAVFAILVLEAVGIPLPAETLLVVAAMLAGRGDLSLPGLFFAAWAGSVVGDNVGYAAGRLLGQAMLLRFGGKIGLSKERLEKIEASFARYGAVAVGFARFVNILRQMNGPVAGAMTMPWLRFVFFDALGGGIWVALWVAVGDYLGRHEQHVIALVHKLGRMGAITAVILMAILACVIFRRRIASFWLSRRDMKPEAPQDRISQPGGKEVGDP